MVSFHSYVRLPEGNYGKITIFMAGINHSKMAGLWRCYTHIMKKSPCFLEKSQLFLEKSPLFPEKYGTITIFPGRDPPDPPDPPPRLHPIGIREL